MDGILARGSPNPVSVFTRAYLMEQQ